MLSTRGVGAFARRALVAWLRLFAGLCVVALIAAAIEIAEIVSEGIATWDQFPALLLTAAPPLLVLALQGSVLALLLIVVISGPIVWFVNRGKKSET